MASHVIEGTWEEIERRKAELIGRHLRVTILSEKPSAEAETTAVSVPKKLIGRGAFQDALPSTEDSLREKQAEIDWEEHTAQFTSTDTQKELRGRGMLAGLLTTEDYLREKRADSLREDRSFG